MPVSPLIPEPKRQFFDNNGNPASGFKLFIYEAGTTTKATTFSESDGLTPNANPIILNSRGEPGNGVYVGPGAYKVVLAPDTDTDPPTSPIWTRDNLFPLSSGGFLQQQTLTSIAGQTVFTFTTISYTPGINSLSIFINGLRQRLTVDYTESSTTSITMTYPLQAGDEVTGVVQVANGLAGTIDAANVSYTPAGTGAVVRNVKARLDDIQTAKNFGVGDGIANDSTAITNLNAIAGWKYKSQGTYSAPSVAATALDGPFFGPGRIQDANGKRGHWFAAIKAAPSALGNHDSVDTAFDGDISRSIFQVEHRITGAATLGQPVSTYQITPEAYPHYTFLHNSSGHNESTSSNTGRTLAVAYRVKAVNIGQGDCAAFNANLFVNNTRAGSTSFLANPAVSIINGSMTPGQAGCYLNPAEFDLKDAGFDVACVGWVLKMNRTVNTGAKDVYWQGFRVQSNGSVEIESAFNAVGPMLIAYDASFAVLPGSGTYTSAAFVMKANQRFYGNASGSDASTLGRISGTLNTDYFTFSSSLLAWNFVVGNSSALQVYTNQVVIPAGKALAHNTGNLGFFATTPTGQKTVTGSRGGNAALASLLTQLAAYGLIIDSSSA